MNTHSTPKPATTGGTEFHPGDSDLIAGTPPVPITVWRTAHTDSDAAGTVGRRLAERIVSAYSQPGAAVVDLTDGHALTQACHTGNRRHHRAWFTAASSLIVGPASQPTTPSSGDRPVSSADTAHHDADGEDLSDEFGADAVELAAWFGDDLTDPGLPDTDTDTDSYSGSSGRDGDGGLAGQTGLIVATWPLDTASAAGNASRLAFLLQACRQLLRPGGCLVLVVTAGDGPLPAPEDFTPVVGAASEHGLGYLQHIVAVGAGTDGDRFTYYATDADLTELAALADAQAGGHWYLHMRVHHDLLVFLAQPRTTSTGGGDARG